MKTKRGENDMKKRVPLFIVIALVFSILQFACKALAQNFIEDNAKIFGTAQIESITSQIEKSRIKLYVKTENNIDNPITAKDEFINRLSIDNSSAVLLLDMQKRKAYLYFGADVGSNLTEKEILDKYFIPYARDKKFYDGLLNLVAGIQKEAFLASKNDSPSQGVSSNPSSGPLYEGSDGTMGQINQYINMSYYGTLLLYLLLTIIIIAFIYNFVSRKRKKRALKQKNTRLVEEYFQDISQRIVDLDEKIPYLKLTDDYKKVEEKYNDVILNFSKLKEYYDGLKSSYTENEFSTFVNIYRIIKSDLDFIQEVMNKAATKIDAEIEKKKKIEGIILNLKNKDILKPQIEHIYQNMDNQDVIKDEIEGIKKVDEEIEKFKNLPGDKREEYVSQILNELTRRFEEKYPLILTRMGVEQANAIEKEYNTILEKIKNETDDTQKLILTTQFIFKLTKEEDEIFKEQREKQDKTKDILDRFSKLKEQYDEEDFKCYKIDLKIEQINGLLKEDFELKKAENLIDELERFVKAFKKDVSECKRLLNDYSKFLEEAKGRLFYKRDYDVLKAYENELKKLLYECRFDEFRRRYIEIEDITRKFIQDNFPENEDIFKKDDYKDVFNGSIPFILFGMLSSMLNDSMFHHHRHHKHDPFGGGFFGGSSSWGDFNSDDGGWSSDGGKFDSGNDSNSSRW